MYVTEVAHLSPSICCLQDKCHPQTIAVCQSRADGLGLKVLVSSEEDFKFDKDVSGILMQYPATDGAVHDYKVSYCCCCVSYSLEEHIILFVAFDKCLSTREDDLKPLVLESSAFTGKLEAVLCSTLNALAHHRSDGAT